MENSPLITVVMPVYNAAAHLRLAIESILQQECSDFEFIILNDGSTDDSAAIISSFDDARIVFVSDEVNSGLVKQLNTGFDRARGKYIARMDADDIALPTRLARQVAYLEGHPAVGLCSCWLQTIGPDFQMSERPVTHDEIRHCFLLGNPIAHPGVMLRTSLVREHDVRYEHQEFPTEDYYLWCRLSLLTQLHILPEILLHYRVHPSQVSAQRGELQNAYAANVKVKYLQQHGIVLSAEEERLFRLLVSAPALHQMDTAQRTKIAAVKAVVIERLVARGFSKAKLEHIMAIHWARLLGNARQFNPGLLRHVISAEGMSRITRLKLVAKCVIFWKPRVSA